MKEEEAKSELLTSADLQTPLQDVSTSTKVLASTQSKAAVNTLLEHPVVTKKEE